MATEKQILANRLNSEKSTGPRTEEGKAIARLNSTTHGLSGSEPDAPGLEDLAGEKLEQLRDEFRNELRPNTLEQQRLVDSLAADTLRIDMAWQGMLAFMNQKRYRAKHFWEQDQLNQAEQIYSKLHKDPARWLIVLKGSRAGCFVLITRWEELQSCLIKHKTWTDNQRSMAHDLLGLPIDIRNGDNRVDPTDSDDVYEDRLALCQAELKDFNQRFADLKTLDNYNQRQEELGTYFMLTKEAALFHRYEQAAERRFKRNRERLIELGCKSRPVPLKKPAVKEELSDTAQLPTLIAEPEMPEPPVARQLLAIPVPSVPKAPPTRQSGQPTRKLNRQQRRAQAAHDRKQK